MRGTFSLLRFLFGLLGSQLCKLSIIFTLFRILSSCRVLTSILILKSLSSMVQRLRSVSSFNPPPVVYGGDDDLELESVECFSVESLEPDIRKKEIKTSCTQNGFNK